MAGEVEFVQLGPAPVFMSMEELAHFETRIAPSLDLFVYQPISARARGPRFSAAAALELVPESCVCLSFQYLHFELYTPFVNLPGHRLGPSPLGYLDFALVGAYLDGLTPEAAAGLAAAAPLTRADVAEIEGWTLTELRMRETSELGPVDFAATDFIAANFRRAQLFHTVNHPAGEVFRHLASRIADRLCATGVLPAPRGGTGAPIEPLERIRYPCLPQVRRWAGLEFPEAGDGLLHHRGRTLTPLECAKQTFAYLESKPRDAVAAEFDRIAAKRPWFDSVRAGRMTAEA